MTTVGQYLIDRLHELGLRHIFGIPGDYILKFYDQVLDSNIEMIGTSTEIGAGFAADAYARVNGLGAVCITYCVGGFNLLNAVAGAFAEKSPLIVISGAPGLSERKKFPHLHHKVRDFSTQFDIFEKITVSSVALENPDYARVQIDDALQKCLRFKRPIYIEIPRDIIQAPCPLPVKSLMIKPHSMQSETLKEAVGETLKLIRESKKTVILAGVEIHRFGLQDVLIGLAEKTGFAVSSTLLGKSVFPENHSQYLGVYEGAMGTKEVQKEIEKADLVLALGAFMTDINLGIYTANLDLNKMIHATSERIMIMHHIYENVSLADYIQNLKKQVPKGRASGKKFGNKPIKPFQMKKNKAITIVRLFECINACLNANNMVICDIGDSLFGAVDLVIQRKTEFLSPAYYTSMGFAVPASLGAQIRQRHLRPLVFVGDGAFQMTGMELSSIVKYGLDPVVFILNNKGYTTERFIGDGPYNDILEWKYENIIHVLGAGKGFNVRTEEDLISVLKELPALRGQLCLINVHLDKWDHSKALKRLGDRLGTQTGNTH